MSGSRTPVHGRTHKPGGADPTGPWDSTENVGTDWGVRSVESDGTPETAGEVLTADGSGGSSWAAAGGAGGFNALAKSLGLVAWTFPPIAAGTSIRPFNVSDYVAIYLDAGDVVTALGLGFISVPAGINHAYMALYDSSRSRVAISADTPTLSGSIGYRTATLTSPYTATYSGVYYIAGFFDPSANWPSIIATTGNGTIGSSGFPGGGFECCSDTISVSPPSSFAVTNLVTSAPFAFAV